jgi:1-acyl-sn-glycerol-3-phosphate acyltransferase
VIRAAVFWTVTVLATAFFSLVSMIGGLFRAPRALHDWVHRNWSRSLLWASGTTVEVAGLENVDRERAQIFASNHQSFFDIFALMHVLPVSIRFVAKHELGRIPLLAQAMRAAGHVFIDRGDRTGAVRVMRKAGRRMERENLSLGLFPEGTRSPDGQLQPFKKGTFVLAIETDAPIVPVAVDGGNRILRRGTLQVRPGRIQLRFCRKIATADLTARDRDPVVSHVRGEITSMLSEIRTAPRATAGPV